MNKILIKWCILCAIGAGLIIVAAISIYRENYNLVVIYLFLGIFLVLASLKRIHLIKMAYDAVKKGRPEITIFYRDRNLVESKTSIIPVWADSFYFYGYLPEKYDVKTFRWEGIWRALDNETELDKEDILKRLSG